MFPPQLYMWSDKSEAQNWQKTRMEVDAKIKAQSGRKHLKFPLRVSALVCFFNVCPPEKRKLVRFKASVGVR